MKFNLFLVVLMAAAPIAAQTSRSDAETKILALENAWNQAQIHHDAAASLAFHLSLVLLAGSHGLAVPIHRLGDIVLAGSIIAAIDIGLLTIGKIQIRHGVVVAGAVLNRHVEILQALFHQRPVQLLNLRADALGQHFRIARAIVVGQRVTTGLSPLLDLNFLSKQADLKPGQKVYTSGVGGVFPSGLLIGMVKSFRVRELDGQAQLTPAVDLSHLEDVFVVTGRK